MTHEIAFRPTSFLSVYYRNVYRHAHFQYVAYLWTGSDTARFVSVGLVLNNSMSAVNTLSDIAVLQMRHDAKELIQTNP